MALSAIRGAVNLLLAAFMPSYGQTMLEAGKKFDVKYNYGEEEAGVSCPSPATCHPSSSSSGSRWFSPLKLREVFAADLRSIALWRVLVGLTIVGDLIDRGQYIYEHYTDYGVMPRYAVLENYWNEYYISPHLITGSLLGQRLIFLFHAICGLCLAVGFYSRTSAFLCWLMAYSIQVRNPFLLHGGDQYMRLLLFWSIFLPLGKCCSIDNALWYSKAAEEKGKPHRRYITRATAAALGLEEGRQSEPVEDFAPNSKLGAAMAAPPATSVPSSFRRPGFVLQQEQKRAGLSSPYSTSSGASKFSDVRNLILTAGSLAIIGQIVTMYVASVYHKSGRQWHEDGTSVYYALQLDYFRMPLGDFFLWLIGDPRNNPFLWWMTWIVVQWEYWGNVLFFSPIWTPACRMIACLGFMAMHLGFSMSLRLGTFFYITFSAPMVAFPSAFWDECVFTAPAHLYSSKDSEAEQSSAPSTVPSRASQKQRSIQAKLLDPSWLWSKFLDLLPFARLCTPERVMTIVYDDSHPRLSNFIRCISSLFLVPCHRLLPLSAYIPSSVSTAEESDAPSSVASLVMVSNGKEYEDEEAVVQIFLRSPILWPIGWLLSLLLRAFPGRCRCPHWVFSRLLTPHTSKADNEDRDADVSDSYDSASEQTSDSSATTSGAGGSGSNSTSPTKGSGAAFAYPRRGRNSRGKIRWRKVGWYVMQTVVVLLFTLVICWNAANFRKVDVSRVHWVGWLLGLDQAWGMFSPHPPLADWYHVIEARLEDNSTVDLIPDEGLFKWEGRPLTWEKPVPIYWSYMKSHRWQKVWENFNDDHEWYRLQVGRFICREYNRRHRGIAFGSPKLRDFTIWVIYNEQRLDNTRGPKEKVILWRHMC